MERPIVPTFSKLWGWLIDSRKKTKQTKNTNKQKTITKKKTTHTKKEMLKRNSPKWIRNKKHFELGKGNTGTLSKKRKEFNHICQEYLLSPNFSSGFMCQAVCGSVRSHIWDWQKKLTNFCRITFHSKMIWYCASSRTGYSLWQRFFQTHSLHLFFLLYCENPWTDFPCSLSLL